MFKRLAQFILADAFHWLSDDRLFEELRQKHWGGTADVAVSFFQVKQIWQSSS